MSIKSIEAAAKMTLYGMLTMVIHTGTMAEAFLVQQLQQQQQQKQQGGVTTILASLRIIQVNSP